MEAILLIVILKLETILMDINITRTRILNRSHACGRVLMDQIRCIGIISYSELPLFSSRMRLFHNIKEYGRKKNLHTICWLQSILALLILWKSFIRKKNIKMASSNSSRTLGSSDTWSDEVGMSEIDSLINEELDYYMSSSPAYEENE